MVKRSSSRAAIVWLALAFVLPVPSVLLAAWLYGTGDWHRGIMVVAVAAITPIVFCVIMAIVSAWHTPGARAPEAKDGGRAGRVWIAVMVLALLALMGLLFFGW